MANLNQNPKLFALGVRGKWITPGKTMFSGQCSKRNYTPGQKRRYDPCALDLMNCGTVGVR